MPRFPRSLPDDVRARLDLTAREKVLAHARLTGGWAVATTYGLAVVPDDGEGLRRPWTSVGTARLDGETATLTVEWMDAEPTALHLADAAATRFPATLRHCVDASVVHSERVDLPGRTVVQVALRRGADGDLFTQVIGPAGVDLDDPATAAAVDAAEHRVREAAGLA